MSETKFTKGEWVAGRPDMGTEVDGYLSKWIYAGDQYCAVASGRIEGDWEEVMANAYLVAQSPKLYKALEETTEELAKLIEMYNEVVKDPCEFADGQTCHENTILLAKARGEK